MSTTVGFDGLHRRFRPGTYDGSRRSSPLLESNPVRDAVFIVAHMTDNLRTRRNTQMKKVSRGSRRRSRTPKFSVSIPY